MNLQQELKADGEDDEQFVQRLKKELLGSRETAQGLSNEGIEMALYLYGLDQDKLPPRAVASANIDHMKMPIPFKNMASES